MLPKSSNGKPKENLKIIYEIGNKDRRITTKILKMDENNQHRNAMTKPLPTGSIKRKKIPTMREVDLMIHGIWGGGKIGHLFEVDIRFHQKNASEKQLFFYKTHSSIFKKKKVLSENERSVFQILDAMRLNDKGKIDSFKTTAKTHVI